MNTLRPPPTDIKTNAEACREACQQFKAEEAAQRRAEPQPGGPISPEGLHGFLGALERGDAVPLFSRLR